MKHGYDDLLDIAKPNLPTWWDECGVPRFCEPHPSKVNCIYSSEVLFFNIQCQACRTKFLVATVRSFYGGSLQESILDHRIHYGDPPNTGCCDAGPTMNSEPLTVHSFWRRENHEWQEVPELRNRPLDESLMIKQQ